MKRIIFTALFSFLLTLFFYQSINAQMFVGTVKKAEIDIATADDNEIIAAVTGKSIVITHMSILNNVGTSQTVIFKDGATSINGSGFALAGNGGYTFDAPGGVHVIRLSASTAFNINLSAATNLSGYVIYYED